MLGSKLFDIPSYLLSQFTIGFKHCGWSGDLIVMGKLPLLGRPTSLDNRRAKACNGCGWGWFGHFSPVYHFSSLCLTLGDGPLFSKGR